MARIYKLLWVAACLSVFLLFSFEEPKLKKRITDKEFKYEFYVTDKKPDIKSGRLYFWFKGGAIHSSEVGASGELLDDAFNKFYLSNQLAEQGTFSRGLKNGNWKTWYSNGTLETFQYWHEGRRNGNYKRYSDTGALIEKGRYRANKKQGQWIDFRTNDTMNYDRGNIILKVKEEKPLPKTEDGVKKPGFFKRLFSKKDKSKSESDTESNLKQDNQKKNTKNIKKADKPKTFNTANPNAAQKKPGFFQRLFAKKEK